MKGMTPYKALEAAINSAKNNQVKNRLEEITWAPGYVEPGYDAPDEGVFFGNWNEVDEYDRVRQERVVLPSGNLPKRLVKVLEKLGAEVAWSDEWQTCNECQRAVRSSPDSYSWKPSYVFFEESGDVICHECVDPEDYLQDLEGDPNRCITLDIDPTEYGYELYQDGFENGFHPGQTDDPKKIAEELRAKGIEKFVFKLDSVGQFDQRFSVYVYEDES